VITSTAEYSSFSTIIIVVVVVVVVVVYHHHHHHQKRPLLVLSVGVAKLLKNEVRNFFLCRRRLFTF